MEKGSCDCGEEQEGDQQAAGKFGMRAQDSRPLAARRIVAEIDRLAHSFAAAGCQRLAADAGVCEKHYCSV